LTFNRPDKLDRITDDLCGYTYQVMATPRRRVRLWSLSAETSICVETNELAPVIAYLQAALDASQTPDPASVALA